MIIKYSYDDDEDYDDDDDDDDDDDNQLGTVIQLNWFHIQNQMSDWVGTAQVDGLDSNTPHKSQQQKTPKESHTHLISKQRYSHSHTTELLAEQTLQDGPVNNSIPVTSPI